jgi:hypothetical protein
MTESHSSLLKGLLDVRIVSVSESLMQVSGASCKPRHIVACIMNYY